MVQLLKQATFEIAHSHRNPLLLQRPGLIWLYLGCDMYVERLVVLILCNLILSQFLVQVCLTPPNPDTLSFLYQLSYNRVIGSWRLRRRLRWNLRSRFEGRESGRDSAYSFETVLKLLVISCQLWASIRKIKVTAVQHQSIFIRHWTTNLVESEVQ